MALVGDLKDLNIATIIQLNCVEKNTAELMVSARRGPATVYFSKGEIIHASYASEKGEEALYKILGLSEGEFRVVPLTDVPDRTIDTSWESLLLEGMRVIDEAEKGKAQIAESIGEELNASPDIQGYVIASKKGEIIAANGASDGERLAAAAVLLSSKGHAITSRMGLGDLTFSALLNDKEVTFFADCGSFLAAIVARKSALCDRVHALVDNLRSRLKYCELRQVPKGVEVTP
jgi:predicted regulator of Ras-like GTPase activity (Roadblock/LC7/MglB family)